MSVRISETSRLRFADLLIVDGVEFWDTLVLPPTRPRPDDLVYEVKSNDRIDLIAQRFYQNAVLWWVIAWANDLEIIPTDLKEGMIIAIPSLDFVTNQLLKRVRS